MGVFNVIKNAPKFFELFKEGKEVADPATWKNRTIATNVVLALIGTVLGLAKAFGYPLSLDDDTIQNLAAGIVAAVGVVNAVMHVITSTKVGLPANSGTTNGNG
jgi:hypothetical protein